MHSFPILRIVSSTTSSDTLRSRVAADPAASEVSISIRPTLVIFSVIYSEISSAAAEAGELPTAL